MDCVQGVHLQSLDFSRKNRFLSTMTQLMDSLKMVSSPHSLQRSVCKGFTVSE